MVTKYTFTQNWFTENIPHWEVLLKKFKKATYVNALEVGCFEGRATVWLLENILTDPTCTITVVDTFRGSQEHGKDMIEGLEQVFLDNVKNFSEKVIVQKGASRDILPKLVSDKKFHIVYIDGSHIAKDVIFDALVAWRMLEKGGIMIFDDYEWKAPFPEHKKPQMAVNMFLDLHVGEWKILATGYQVVLEKI